MNEICLPLQASTSENGEARKARSGKVGKLTTSRRTHPTNFAWMKQQPRNEHLPFPETFPKEKMLSQFKGMKQFCFRSIYFGNLLSRWLSISRRPPLNTPKSSTHHIKSL
jgi:hypothetical protein